MNSMVRKWIVRPLVVLITLFAAVVAIIFIILSTQQQRLVNLALEEVNQQFKGEVTIGDSEISLLKTFPYVSVVLHDGKFYPDKSKSQKPIYEFRRLYVGFNLAELLREEYNVRTAHLEGGYLNLVQEVDGKINLVEAESPVPDTTRAAATATESNTAFAIALHKIILEDLNVTFHDKASNIKVNSHIANLVSSFELDSADMTFAANSDMILDVLMPADTSFFRHKKFGLAIVADYEFETNFLKLSSCNVKLEEAGFDVKGFANFYDTTEVSFRIKGDGKDFNLVTAFLPDHVKEKLIPFQYDGELNFDGVVRGKVAENKQPLVELNFACSDAWFLNTAANKKVDQLGFKGFYTNGKGHSLKTSELHVINASARPEKGVFSGHFVVRDFTNPQAVVKINSELELKFLGQFLGIANLKQTTGKIKLDMNFKELHDIKLPEESLNKLKEGIQSRLVVEDLSFRIPGYPYPVRDMNIKAEMKDGRVTIDSVYLKIGDSDLELNGSISDVRAFIREREKSVNLALNVKSAQVKLGTLLSYDTALARAWNEEIHDFSIALKLETTVKELLNPSPLPKGTFEVKNLRGTFKNYAHTLKDIGATVLINDTLLRLRDFTGMIDSSDINFKGRVINYHLWFDSIKKGKTQIAFDFRSNHFALKDVLGREIRRYLPRGYRREQLNNVWLRAKIDLRYDTTFRFAKGKITNISADLKKHNLKLHEISGGFKYGSRILALDTLKGKVGNSDFFVNLKYYFKGVDRNNNKVANSLKFTSTLLDVDEMSHYDLAPKKGRSKRDSTRTASVAKPDSSVHATAFNVFMIPFSDFNAEISIGKIKYNRLWLKDVNARITMKPDQTIMVDTLTLKVAGGAIRMRGKFNGSNHEKIYFRSRIHFDQVDIAKMMLKFDHFGQDVVVNKNIKGRLSGYIRSYVQVHPDLVPIVSNSKAEMNLSIYNGSLVDFAPMQAMASYFKDKNLRLIRFDTLENKLTFTNGVLEIPTMDINSSLGYIQMSGKQSLDLSMEYYLRVPMKMVTKAGLGSLLNRKPEEVDVNQVDEIDYVDKDKRMAFMNLKVTGTPQNYKVGLGRDKAKKVL
jgi:hypothetical protein